MNRNELIAEVKTEYAKLSAAETQNHFHQTTIGVTPEEYYETLLYMVLREIDSGTFDSFRSGRAIVDAVAADKSKWLSQWE